MGFDYMGMSYQSRKPPRGSRMGHLWPLVLFVFLVLAALYESWSLSMERVLSTPVAVFGPSSHLAAARCARLVSAAVHGSDGEHVYPRLVL